MSAFEEGPTTANVEGQPNGDAPWFRFPPFPSTEGKNVVSFANFKPKGIQITMDDDQVEVDGEGIPTIMLKVIHNLDKTKKRKKRKTVDPSDPNAPNMTWWEEWEDGDLVRNVPTLDPNMDQTDRLHQIEAAFKTGRTFPIAVRELYDQFRVYIGLISNPVSTHRKTKERPAEPEEAPEDEMSDDEEAPASGAPIDEHDLPESKIEEVDPNAPIDTFSRFEYDGDDLRQQRVFSFLLDPEKSIKVFFSSYYRDRGLLWNDYNLRTGPKIVHFFLSFIIRHRAFQEYERGFKRALEIAERAKQELPQTKIAALAMSDGWGKACTALWGSQVPQKWGAGIPDSFLESLTAFQEEDDGTTKPVPIPTTLEIINDAVDIDMNGEEFKVSEPYQFDTTAGGWNTEEVVDNFDADEFYANTQAAQTWDAVPSPTPTSFLAFVGPSTFPITHAPVRVESSTRVILSVAPPSSSSHLHSNLATVVLGPCVAHLNSPSPTPTILRPEMLLDKSTEFKLNVGGGDGHDPLTSCITIFVEPSAIEKLMVGLLMGGVWVQVAPIPGVEVAQVEKKKKSKSSKSKGAAADGRLWWYAEDVGQVLPSFWIETDPTA